MQTLKDLGQLHVKEPFTRLEVNSGNRKSYVGRRLVAMQ